MYFHMVSPRSLPVSFVDNLEVLCDKIPDLLASSSALKFFCSLPGVVSLRIMDF